MELKERPEYICKIDNCECICHKAPKLKPTCKIENCGKWSVSNGVCINHGAKRAKCKTENCNYRKNHSLSRRHGAENCHKTRLKGGFCSQHRGKYFCKFENCKKNFFERNALFRTWWSKT